MNLPRWSLVHHVQWCPVGSHGGSSNVGSIRDVFFATGWLLFGNSGYMSNASFSVYQHTNRSLKRFTTAKLFRSLWKSSAPSKMIFDCVAQCFMSHSHASSNHPSSTVQQDMVVRPVLSKDVMLGWRPQVLHNGDLDKSWQVGVHFSLGTKLLFLLLSKADPSLFYMYLHWKKHDAKPTQPNKTLWTQQYINSHLYQDMSCFVPWNWWYLDHLWFQRSFPWWSSLAFATLPLPGLFTCV